MNSAVNFVQMLIGVLAVASVFPTLTPASDRVSGHMSDSAIKATVERNLSGRSSLQSRDTDIHVSVDDRIVTLTGTVPSISVMHEVEKVVRKSGKDLRVENRMTVIANRSDEHISADVSGAIRRYPFYNVFYWVQGSVNNGIVTLTGAVQQPWHKTGYQQMLESVPGVKQIHNQLRILPVSYVDERLRDAASLAIYGDPTFHSFASQPNPPIHVIVENGKITLEGAVANALQRQVAESRVRTRVVALDVINNLKIESIG
jgi:hyperosmotically inducible protein